ncbi:hypothetical protein ACFL20_10155 [Spirochaetota bacterium]
MSKLKEQVIEIINKLPEESTIDDIMVELHFKSQVDQGLKELDEGKGIPHEQMKNRVSQWLTK